MAPRDVWLKFEDGTEATVTGLDTLAPKLKDHVAWEAKFPFPPVGSHGATGVAFFMWRSFRRQNAALAGDSFEDFLERLDEWGIVDEPSADPAVGGEGEPDPPTPPLIPS